MDFSGFSEDDIAFPKSPDDEAEVLCACWLGDGPRGDTAREYIFSFLHPRDFFAFGDVFAGMRARWHKGLFVTKIQRDKAFYGLMETYEHGWLTWWKDGTKVFLFVSATPSTFEIFVRAMAQPFLFDYPTNCAILRRLRILRAESMLTHQSLCRLVRTDRAPGEFLHRMRPYFDTLAELIADSAEVLRCLPSRLS